jgi:hypothetical protein
MSSYEFNPTQECSWFMIRHFGWSSDIHPSELLLEIHIENPALWIEINKHDAIHRCKIKIHDAALRLKIILTPYGILSDLDLLIIVSKAFHSKVL